MGDGTTRGSGITGEDEFIFEEISRRGYRFGHTQSKSGNKATTRYILDIRTTLKAIGVFGNKFIPEEYFTASIKQREELLQGIVDTDGTIVKGGRNASITTISGRLKDDYVRLIRSLGGTATAADNYTTCEGKKFHSYRISFRIHESIIPALLPRKRVKWTGSIKTKSAIESIEYVGEGLARCISVESKDGLYITDDYLVTHNSATIARVYALHAALFRRKKDIVIISASEALAIEHLRYIKQTIENNEILQAFWGNLRSDKWTETHLGIKHSDGSIVNIRARGAGAQIRGFRPDCIILDDIETDDSVLSEDQRRKLKGWLFKACLNSLSVNGQFIFIGTIIHPLAVINDLFQIKNGWTKRKWAAYKTDDQVEGNELWPKLWPHDRLQKRKSEIGSSAFASEYLNNPLLDENAPIKDEDIRYWEELPKQYSCVIAIDPAYSEEERADYKVAALVAMDAQHNRYLLDYIRSHDTTLDFVNGILNMYLRNQQYITAVGCPHSGGDKEFYSSLLRISEERRVYPPFVELKNTFVSASGAKVTNKLARVKAALQPLFENGKYYINTSHLEARDELLSLGSAQHDDLCDAMAYAESLLTPVYFEDKTEMDETEQPVVTGYGIEY